MFCSVGMSGVPGISAGAAQRGVLSRSRSDGSSADAAQRDFCGICDGGVSRSGGGSAGEKKIRPWIICGFAVADGPGGDCDDNFEGYLINFSLSECNTHHDITTVSTDSPSHNIDITC